MSNQRQRPLEVQEGCTKAKVHMMWKKYIRITYPRQSSPSLFFPCFMPAHTAKQASYATCTQNMNANKKPYLFLKMTRTIGNPKENCSNKHWRFAYFPGSGEGWLSTATVSIPHLAAEKPLVSLQRFRLARLSQNHLARCTSSSLVSRLDIGILGNFWVIYGILGSRSGSGTMTNGSFRLRPFFRTPQLDPVGVTATGSESLEVTWLTQLLHIFLGLKCPKPSLQMREC